MSNHGIFINYKRSHKHLAGRIFDYFRSKGISPFIDEHSLHQTENYWNDIENEIKNCPYFLCLLTKDGLDELLSENYAESIYYKEIETAFKYSKSIKVLLYGDISYSSFSELPPAICKLKDITSYRIPESSRLFYDVMDKLYRNDIDLDKLKGVINWQEHTSAISNTLVLSRQSIENGSASLENRFGYEFMECVKNKTEFKGQYIIQEINMLCYAANIIFSPDINLVDRHAYDYGTMFNLFTYLLQDEEFNLRIITTAPASDTVKDAIAFEKIGNSAVEDNEEIAFFSSYAGIRNLMETEPYKTSINNRRFTYMLTECVLPYALFHTVYKKGYEQFNHIKVDLYSVGIDSVMERRSMMFFEKDQKENYDFFVNQFKYIKNVSRKRSSQLIRENHNTWIDEWKKIQSEHLGGKI